MINLWPSIEFYTALCMHVKANGYTIRLVVLPYVIVVCMIDTILVYGSMANVGNYVSFLYGLKCLIPIPRLSAIDIVVV